MKNCQKFFISTEFLVSLPNNAYLATAFIQKPPPIFCSIAFRKTSDIPIR